MHASAVPLRASEPAIRSGGMAGVSAWPGAHVRRIVLLLTLGAAVLRLYHIGLHPFWQNELFGLYWVRNDVGFLLTRGLFTETNPPLHFLLLKLWTWLFGTDEFAVRSLSALASIAGVPLIYRLGRELHGARLGLAAAALLALSPVQIFLAQEARVYAFLPLFVMTAMLGLCRFLRSDTDVAAARNGLALYAAAAVALLYSHATAVPLLASLGLSTLACLRGSRASWWHVRAFLVVTLLSLVLAAPALAAMAGQIRSPNIAWIPTMTGLTPLILSHYLLVGPMARTDLGPAIGMPLLFGELGLAVAAALLLVLAAPRAVGDRRTRMLVLLFPALYVGLVCAISLVRPILEPRIMAWLSVPICLGMAFLLTAPSTRRLRPMAGVLLAGGIAIGLCDNLFWPAQVNPDWRGFLRDADLAAADAPLLVIAPHAGALGIAFYADRPVRAPLRQWVPAPEQGLSNAEALTESVAGATPISTAAIAALIRSGRHLRLLLSSGDIAELSGVLAALPGFSLARRQDYPGLRVYTW